MKVSCIPCTLSYKRSDKELNIEQKPGGEMVIETNENLINVSFNRGIR